MKLLGCVILMISKYNYHWACFRILFGKLGRWRKIFGLKLEKSQENLPFEFGKTLDIEGNSLEYKTFEIDGILIDMIV